MNKNGSVLMITLWILTILVIFTLSLGQRASINLKLVRNQRDRLKALYLANAGINKAIAILKEDAVDAETRNYDTQDACGVNLKNKKPEDIFSQKLDNENEGFKIGYQVSSGEFRYGFQDEESRININNIDNTALLVELFKLKEIENYEELADTIIDWIDDNKDSISSVKENEVFKNEPLKITKELLLILEYFYQNKGMKDYRNKAQEVFDTVRDLITVYGEGALNINTASADAVKILAYSVVNETAQVSCIETVAGEIIRVRDEKINNAQPFKETGDIKIEDTKLTDASCIDLFNNLKDKFIFKSNYFRINSTGRVDKISKKITAIVERAEPIKIVYWHEN